MPLLSRHIWCRHSVRVHLNNTERFEITKYMFGPLGYYWQFLDNLGILTTAFVIKPCRYGVNKTT